MKRRDAIKAMGAMAGAASMSQFLSACANDGDDGPQGITTMVFMMMENRSYDHYLGVRSWLDGKAGDGLADGMSNPDIDGNMVAPWPATEATMCLHPDPPHGWGSSRTQLNGGENDGFLLAHQGGAVGAIEPMQYMTRQNIPVHHALADAYTSCDRWFGSVLGPTLPNRMYWHTGTANGSTNNQQVLDGAFNGIPSIHHRMDDAGVDWAYYYGDVPVLGVIDDIPDVESRLRRFYYEFLDDCYYGRLPPVVHIDPGFGSNDDHPPHHPLLGQQLIAATYNALATSPQWNNCMLVITYDENGGFYDHVAPPKAPDDLAADGFDQLGFRVPAIVVGPYAKQGHVSSVQYDHTSALKHIENVHGTEPLTTRSNAANDLIDCLDLERLMNNDPAPPITLPAVEVDESMLPESCNYGGTFIVQDHDILVWAETAEGKRKLGDRDRRPYTRDYVYGIADYLDKHNLGRIRRGK